jgi:hypothetical protein
MDRISIRGVAAAALVLGATSLTGTMAAQGALGAGTPGASALTAHVTPGDMSAAAQMFEVHSAHRVGMAVVTGRAAAAARLRAMVAARNASARVAQARARRARAAAAATARAERIASTGSIRSLGLRMASARGWGGQQFLCLNDIWTHESNWNPHAYNAHSGAYGIPQAVPGSKLSAAGGNWRNSPAVQIAWGLSYIARVYRNPCAAWGFWQAHQWY